MKDLDVKAISSKPKKPLNNIQDNSSSKIKLSM